MKPNTPALPSENPADLWHALRSPSVSTDALHAWLQRAEARRPRRAFPVRSAALVAALLLIGFVGCLPVQQEETIGYVAYWAQPGLRLDDSLRVGKTQGAVVLDASRKRTHYVGVFMGKRGGSDTRQAIEQARRAHAQQVVLEPVTMTFDRRAYDAFRRSLPALIQRHPVLPLFVPDEKHIATTVVMAHLAATVRQKIDTPDVTYQYGFQQDSTGAVRLSLRPYSLRPNPVQALLDQYDRLGGAIFKLEAEPDTRVREAVRLLKNARHDVEQQLYAVATPITP